MASESVPGDRKEIYALQNGDTPSVFHTLRSAGPVTSCDGRSQCFEHGVHLTSFRVGGKGFFDNTRFQMDVLVEILCMFVEEKLASDCRHSLPKMYCDSYYRRWTASVIEWSESLATDPEVRVRFPALPDIMRSGGSGTGSTQPREYN
jgi:hypothetical protein